MDNKRHSSRNNEEKQNANVHCSLRCGNYREMVTLFFLFYIIVECKM